MPELPEVETVRRGLAPVLEGRRIVRVTARRADLRRPLPTDLARRLAGRRVDRLGRRGKYILAHLDDGMVLLMHLGMSGRVRIESAGSAPQTHDHVVLTTDAGVSVVFHDPRRFGLMDLGQAETLSTHPLLAGLGPEPLDPDFDGAVLAARLAGRRGPVKAALLDQTVVAGLGNIYACESLFRARLSPRRRGGTIVGRRAGRLAAAIVAVLTDAIAAGGSSLRDHRRPGGELGTFQHRFAVYDREGLACPGCTCDPADGGGIRRIVQSGRSTFYCAMRQR